MKGTAGKSLLPAKDISIYNMQNSVVRVLAYFDMFAYPVSEEEILFFLDTEAEPGLLRESLQKLLQEKYIFRYDRFYSLRDDSSLAGKRIKDNQRAAEMMITARRVAAFLYKFPYVRGIGISGSLSKNVAGENADIDFFIITRANRLWIARTLMHLFKKLTFLVGKQHWYCMNYYVDEEALQVEEQNVYTAMELITLIPVSGNGTMQKFFTANEWATVYYPSYAGKAASSNTTARKFWLKRLVERLLDNRLGDRLDDYLMKVTTKRWNIKEEEERVNINGRRMGLRTGKHYSKPNPAFMQHSLLSLYKNKLAAWEKLRK
ncbi:MAG: hypothetical protein JST39_04550 [Bacteroidetes bacterium]|nr:hypothetical protein [Bacteroidota bacterium]